jgi:hypothetical protein
MNGIRGPVSRPKNGFSAQFPDIDISAQTINRRAYDRLCAQIVGGHLPFGNGSMSANWRIG